MLCSNADIVGNVDNVGNADIVSNADVVGNVDMVGNVDIVEFDLKQSGTRLSSIEAISKTSIT